MIEDAPDGPEEEEPAATVKSTPEPLASATAQPAAAKQEDDFYKDPLIQAALTKFEAKFKEEN